MGEGPHITFAETDAESLRELSGALPSNSLEPAKLRRDGQVSGRKNQMLHSSKSGAAAAAVARAVVAQEAATYSFTPGFTPLTTRLGNTTATALESPLFDMAESPCLLVLSLCPRKIQNHKTL